MMTPQDIREKKFEKAIIGGFDMTQVEEFLEAVTDEYSTLCGENSKLKKKLKVLATEIEKYKATEDAMRLALISAQETSKRISDSAAEDAGKIRTDAQERADELTEKAASEAEKLTSDARAQADSILSQAQSDAASIISRAQEKHDRLVGGLVNARKIEEGKLLDAKLRAAKFISGMRSVLADQTAFFAAFGDLSSILDTADGSTPAGVALFSAEPEQEEDEMSFQEESAAPTEEVPAPAEPEKDEADNGDDSSPDSAFQSIEDSFTAPGGEEEADDIPQTQSFEPLTQEDDDTGAEEDETAEDSDDGDDGDDGENGGTSGFSFSNLKFGK